MNKIYRIVFNQATQTWTAVAENARAKGKSGRATVGSSKLTTLVGASAISVAALLSAQAMAEDTYFHVNTEPATQPVGDPVTNLGSADSKSGATGARSLAAGIGAVAGDRSIAIGNNTQATAPASVVIGNDAKSQSLMSPGNGASVAVGNSSFAANDSVAIGAGANATGENSNSSAKGWATAVGRQAQAIGRGAVALGNGSGAAGIDGIGVGYLSKADGTHSIAMSNRAEAKGNYAIAMGSSAQANSPSTTSIGNRAGYGSSNAMGSTFIGARAGQYAAGVSNTAVGDVSGTYVKGQDNTALGSFSGRNVTGDNNVAIGLRSGANISASDTISIGNAARASRDDAIAIGTRANAAGAFSTANGYSADAIGTRSTSIGSDSQATANFATALGDSAWATAASSTALGTGARSTGPASLAVGSAAQTQAFQSAAFGSGASVYAGGVQALALGSNATTSDANAVALGSGARTAAAVGTSSATINGVTYDGFAGTEPIATVSVGNDTQKRTITNIAAGRITADSTDAINGSQLYAVASELGGEVSNTYFHVNTGTNRNTGNATTNLGSITDAAGATGYGAVTAGVNAQAKGSGSLALGQDSYAVDGEAVAIGLEAGTKATMAKRTVMIGSQAGNSSNTTNSVLLGWQSAYNRAGSGLVAIGSAAAGASTPLDFDNSLTSSVAIGESAAFDASGIWNSYIGTMAGSYKQGKNNVGIGYYAGAGEIGSSGKKTEAGDTGSIGSNNVAFGYFAGSGVDGNDNIAIGQWANTGAKPDGGFIGFNDTVALGRDTVANLDSNVAIGAKANAAAAKGDVALGAGSVTRAVTPTSSATVNNITYGAFAGAKPESAVSVGDVGSERQIQNVAAGQINATSTDAINGSQLYAVADKLTADIKAADTNTVTTVTAGKNITVENIGNADAPNYQVATADQVVFDSVSITNGPTINNNGINMNGNRITNVARGINGTDAVNVDQLNDATSGIYGRIDNLDKDYRAGVAGNAAMMNIPQVTRPGANLLGIGLGHHKGESAVAVGFSSSSDNEQLIFKMSGSANTQGDFTIGSGLGWQW